MRNEFELNNDVTHLAGKTKEVIIPVAQLQVQLGPADDDVGKSFTFFVILLVFFFHLKQIPDEANPQINLFSNFTCI